MALFCRVVIVIYLVDRAIPSSKQWGLEDIINIIFITIKILSFLIIALHVFILDLLDTFICFILSFKMHQE